MLPFLLIGLFVVGVLMLGITGGLDHTNDNKGAD